LKVNPIKSTFTFVVLLLCLGTVETFAQPAPQSRILSGSVFTQQNELLPGVSIVVRTAAGELQSDSGKRRDP